MHQHGSLASMLCPSGKTRCSRARVLPAGQAPNCFLNLWGVCCNAVLVCLFALGIRWNVYLCHLSQTLAIKSQLHIVFTPRCKNTNLVFLCGNATVYDPSFSQGGAGSYTIQKLKVGRCRTRQVKLRALMYAFFRKSKAWIGTKIPQELH